MTTVLRGHLDRLTSQLVTHGRFWLWLLGFLSVTADSALYPRLVSVALAFQMGSFSIEILFKEFNNYSANTRANSLNGIGTGLGKILDFEVILTQESRCYKSVIMNCSLSSPWP